MAGLGRVAAPGDTVVWNDRVLTVSAMDGRRIAHASQTGRSRADPHRRRPVAAGAKSRSGRMARSPS